MTSIEADHSADIQELQQELADAQVALDAALAPNGNAESDTLTSDQQLHVINQFAKDLIRLSSSKDLIWHTVNEVVAHLGFEDCVIYLIDEERNMLLQSAAYGAKCNADGEIINPIEIPIGQGITGHVAESSEPLLIHDTKDDDRYIPDMQSMLSEVCVPILDKGRLLGVIDCEHEEKNKFTDRHIELLTTIASMLGSRLAQWEVLERLKNTQSDLAESEEKYRLLFELSQDPMMLLTENKFELCNEASARVFKYASAEEMQNVHPSKMSPPMQPDDQTSFDKAEKMMTEAFKKGVHRFEWVHQKKTGEDFPMEVTLTKVPYKGQWALYAVCRDITDRKKMDVALHDAVEKANNANQSKTTFLANMSHELRTPLNAIIGFSEMMTEEIFGPLGSEKYIAYADNIQSSAMYLSSMINDILDLSVINASGNKIDRKTLKIDEVIADCYTMMGKLASDNGIDCRHDIQPRIKPVFADEQELKQILINLLANAVKFTPEGGSICLSVHTEDHRHIFKVTDTGCGIPQDRLDTITERFDRGQIDPFEAVEGTGLGLAIVKSLVELHHGTLKINSILGKGTTVTFTLPFKDHLPMDNMEQIELNL